MQMARQVLLVEDDATLGLLTKNMLDKRGFAVTFVQTKSQALDAMQVNEFAIAILDLKLADETSLGLLPELKIHNPNIKILMLTAYASIATAVEAVKRGASNYLPKPATIADILDALDEVESIGESIDDAAVMSTKRLEWEHIQWVLQKNDGNVSASARELNMHRRTLQRKLQKRPVKE